MKAAAALLLASSLGVAPAPQVIETPFATMDRGDGFECLSPSGCVVTTPEVLEALLREAHHRGRASCRPTL
jgi:hypothetical protein